MQMWYAGSHNSRMNAREKSVRMLTIIGGICVLVGGFDPLEGSIAIAAGSVLLAVAAHLGAAELSLRRARYAICMAVLIGVGALWALSFLGGVGGNSGRPMAWLALVLPMPVGWSLSLWIPGTPRWLTWAGVVGGAWYLLLPAVIAWKARTNPNISWPLLEGLALLGAATIGACVWRLRQTCQPDFRR